MEPRKRKQNQHQAEQSARRESTHEDNIDLGSMSPQSRRRYQSRMSSARLRERQRQRITGAEEDVAKLEAYVRSLQSSIDIYYQHQMQGEHVEGNNGNGDDKDNYGAALGNPNTMVSLETNKSIEYFEDFDAIRETVRSLVVQRRHDVAGVRGGDSINHQIHGSIASMNNTVDHLERCVHRIDSLKEMITERVHGLERCSLPGTLISRSPLGGETLRNTTENSSGSAQGSTTGSVLVTDGKMDDHRNSSEQMSRFSISFLVDEDGI